jgi:hypothetical protein
MTLLTVVQGVCAVVGIAVPQSVFTSLSGNRTMQEMVALATEMAQRISYDTRDWTLYRKTQTYAGTGAAAGFPLPVDYKRMLLTGNVWRSTSQLSPMRFVPDTDEWLNRRALNYYDGRGEWTILGGQMQIAPTMAVGVSAYYPYLHKNCVNMAAGGVGDRFQADGDSFALDERLLMLGMIWQWKANKGSPYNEDLGTYGDAMAIAMGRDSPAPIIIDRKPISLSHRVAYPFVVPTP